MRRFYSGVFVSACALAFVLPCTADAGPRIPIAGASAEPCPVRHIVLNVSYTCAAEFTLRASNGYRITVSGDPAGSDPGDLQLTAERGPASVVYIAPETLTPSGVIKASFGRLGNLSLRFHPSGGVRRVRVPKKCLEDHPPVVSARLGTFVGTIRFRGERGYTKVVAHRVEGGVGDPLANTSKKLECESPESDAERAQELKAVALEASDRSAGISFEAARAFGLSSKFAPQTGTPTSGSDRYLFLVVVGEKAGRVSILRFVAAVGPAGDFAFANALTSATVAPPSPFMGTGSFLRNADGSTSWTGPLSVSVPGLGAVRLAEGRFKGELATQARLLKLTEEELKLH